MIAAPISTNYFQTPTQVPFLEPNKSDIINYQALKNKKRN